MNDLKYKKKGEWTDGEIYDARSGKTYSLEIYMKNSNELELRGYIGLTLFESQLVGLGLKIKFLSYFLYLYFLINKPNSLDTIFFSKIT